MARRKQNLFEDLVLIIGKLPWWVGVLLAVAAYFWLHGIATTEVEVTTGRPGDMAKVASQAFFKSFAIFGQYLLPFVCLVGSVLSIVGRGKRNKLHQQVANNPDRSVLSNMSWQDFETLVGEAFRRKGYSVLDVGGGRGRWRY